MINVLFVHAYTIWEVLLPHCDIPEVRLPRRAVHLTFLSYFRVLHVLYGGATASLHK